MDQMHQFGESISRDLGIAVKNSSLFFEAFSHPSFVHENSSNHNSYQRLEFLGDAVLDLIVSEILITEFSSMDEGRLSKLRSQIVNETTLAHLARILNLGDFVLLGKGESQNNGRTRDSILSDVFESLIAAIYRDGGLDNAKKFFLETLNKYLDQNNINLFDLSFDYKSKLQELVMKKYKTTPVYKSKEVEAGFEVSLYINENHIETITASSKKKAQVELAKNTYTKKQNDI